MKRRITATTTEVAVAGMGYTNRLRADIGTSCVESGRQFGTRRGQSDLVPSRAEDRTTTSNPAKARIAGKSSKSPWPLIRRLHEERSMSYPDETVRLARGLTEEGREAGE